MEEINGTIFPLEDFINLLGGKIREDGAVPLFPIISRNVFYGIHSVKDNILCNYRIRGFPENCDENLKERIIKIPELLEFDDIQVRGEEVILFKKK